MKTSELSGAALDWAVAKCEGFDPETLNTKTGVVYSLRYGVYTPSTDWAQGGPIIEREGISINSHLDGYEWFARDYWGMNEQADEKPLIAAMRCYVASKLGDTIDIPNELTGETA
jgi:hypothetical protein